MDCKLFRNKKPKHYYFMASQVKRHERRHNVEDDSDSADVFVAESCIDCIIIILLIKRIIAPAI